MVNPQGRDACYADAEAGKHTRKGEERTDM